MKVIMSAGRNGYDAVFLDVDGTLLWVDLDVEGYARDLSDYSARELTADRARGPVWRSVRTHISENINYRTADELRRFKRENATRTADALGVEAPAHLLAEISDRRLLFTPYEESQDVLEELKDAGVPLYIVSNWDVLLEEVLKERGWLGYFEGVVASAVVGSEKPDGVIFDEALRLSGASPERVIHVGNDANADVRGAAARGIRTYFVDRKGEGEIPEATFTEPDLRALPAVIRGEL